MNCTRLISLTLLALVMVAGCTQINDKVSLFPQKNLCWPGSDCYKQLGKKKQTQKRREWMRYRQQLHHNRSTTGFDAIWAVKPPSSYN